MLPGGTVGGNINCGMDSDPYWQFQVLAMVASVSEALVTMSALYHAYDMMVIKAQEPVSRLVLLAVFLISENTSRT